MALALLTNAVLDVTFGVAFWTAKKAGQGIYYIGSYFLRNDDDGNNDGNNDDNNNGNNGNGNNDDGYQVNNPSNNVILMEEIGKLREEIKDLKESINQ
jgi:hypothetical protein